MSADGVPVSVREPAAPSEPDAYPCGWVAVEEAESCAFAECHFPAGECWADALARCPQPASSEPDGGLGTSAKAPPPASGSLGAGSLPDTRTQDLAGDSAWRSTQRGGAGADEASRASDTRTQDDADTVRRALDRLLVRYEQAGAAEALRALARLVAAAEATTERDEANDRAEGHFEHALTLTTRLTAAVAERDVAATERDEEAAEVTEAMVYIDAITEGAAPDDLLLAVKFLDDCWRLATRERDVAAAALRQAQEAQRNLIAVCAPPVEALVAVHADGKWISPLTLVALQNAADVLREQAAALAAAPAETGTGGET